MSHLSVRLPKEVERRLDAEAELTGRNRSDLVREAVGQYLTQKERDRLIEKMKQAARNVYRDPELAAEARRIQAEFDDVDDTLKWIEAEERATGADPDERWWD